MLRPILCTAVLGTAVILSGFAVSSPVCAQPLRPPELPTPDVQSAANEPGTSQAAANQNNGVEPGYLGLIADDRQENNAGARLKEIVPDSPAAQAGLKPDDLLTAINGRPIHLLEDMAAVLEPLPAGAKITFDVERQGKTQPVTVTLGKRPPPDQRKFQNFGRLPGATADPSSTEPPSMQQSPSSQPLPGQSADARSPMNSRAFGPAPGVALSPPPLLGVRTNSVTENDRARLGLPSMAGAHVIARTRGSAAEKANIPLDAVIVAMNGQAVSSPSDLSALLAQAGAGSTAELTYIYNHQSTNVRLALGAMPAGSPMPSSNAWPPNLPQSGALSRELGRPQYSNTPAMAPPQSNNQVQPSTDAQRIQELERKVHELEQRVKELEDRSQRQT